MSRTNFRYNYPRVVRWLKDNDIEFVEYNHGQHLRIFGAVSLVDLWTSRMRYHVIATEGVDPNKYGTLDYYFNPEQLNVLLNGKI